MALKRSISYQWRLFLPLVALLWLTIATMVGVQYRRERDYKTRVTNQQLEFVNNRIIYAYENNVDLIPFMKFIGEYFNRSVYVNMRVSVYDLTTGQLIYSLGTPIKQYKNPNQKKPNFYYAEEVSADKKVAVYAAMPYSVNLIDALAPERTTWITIFTLAIIVTIIAYITTSILGKNVSLLRSFAKKAATEKQLNISSYVFPKDELGDISRQIINLFNDKITAIEKSEKEHAVAINAIEEKSRLKRELTNNINHEIKTPVGIIKGYIDTIVEDENMSAETQRRFIVKAQEQITRLCNLLNDISTITRLSEAGASIPTESIDFHDLIYTLADDISESGVAGDMKFKFNIPLNCRIEGNASLLSNSVLNLVRNAATYSQGTEIVFELIQESVAFFTFRFYDNGVGVDEQHIPHLFERFYRIDAGRSRKAGGTGLGLPIVKNTILAHGGKINVSNRPQGGLEFRFTLPKLK